VKAMGDIRRKERTDGRDHSKGRREEVFPSHKKTQKKSKKSKKRREK
jgi:hypothetical protein